jgi:hypothetical protein
MKFVPGPTREETEPLLVYEIDRREEALLLATLRLYPVLDSSHHRFSKDPHTATPAEQRLLEEAMTHQALSHRRKLEEMFRSPQRFFRNAAGRRQLALTGPELEWLLQVLNDIRVGSWVRLGCPELEKTHAAPMTGENARALAAMEMSGYFQWALLEAFKS